MTWNSLPKALTDKLELWLDGAIAFLPNLVVALLVLAAAVFVARLARSGTRWSLEQVLPNKQLIDLGAGIARIVTLAAGALIALGVLELDKTVTSLLAGVGVIGLALGFAFQDIAANFMAGVLMAFRQPVHHGDLVETNGYKGTVERVDLRATTVRTFTGEAVLIPNKDVWGNPLTNYTETSGRRVDVDCGVSYDTDLDEAQRLVLGALDDLPTRDRERDISVVWKGFGGSSIDFSVRVWLDAARQPDYLGCQSEIVKRIKRTFDDNGIDIPFPIRTLQMPRGLRVVDDPLPAAKAS